VRNTVWLADLTHTGQSIASDTVPAAVGMIAEALSVLCPLVDHINVFKFPEALARELDNGPPKVLGLSNYIWNFRLSSKVAQIIKSSFPNVIIVMGGPNFPTDSREEQQFFLENPWIDYYIVKEAELAMCALVNALIACQYKNRLVDISRIPNLVAYRDGTLISCGKSERVNDLNQFPSPYLTGRLDPFLNGSLMPVIQTNRGCPFSCAFCTEGQTFWNKVRKKSPDLVAKEISHIANTLAKLPRADQRGDLLIADSNFGMFSEDLETCDAIAKVQEQLGYPSYINVATGKNKKERVLEAARRVNGAMKLAGSVQSLDPEVQRNMKRSNISAEEIVSLALQASEIGTNTYSEVILALPGDTKIKHYDTLKTLVEADFSTISMYQLMLLPGTEFGGDEFIKKHKMTVNYRVIPRAFGNYKMLDQEFSMAEIEAICVAHKDMPYEDYLDCRRLNLIVSIFFNDRVFDETLQVLRWCGLSVFDFMKNVAERTNRPEFEGLINSFLEETEGELWRDQAALRAFVEAPETMKKFIQGQYGSNLIFKYKALSLTSAFHSVCDCLIDNIIAYARLHGYQSESPLVDLMIATVEYKRNQVDDIFFDHSAREALLYFPVDELEKFLNERLLENLEREPRKIIFQHSKEQVVQISRYKKIFGDDVAGLSRILTRARITQFYRIATELK
jgi:radical SAM superfamily enzyme YgiQ (UPF0313 family)